MSNTFDGSSAGAGELPDATPVHQPAPAAAVGLAEHAAANGAGAPVPDLPSSDSLLDQIATEVAERDQGYAEPWEYDIPGTTLRLVCDPRIENEDYQRWVKLSMPRDNKSRRGPRTPSATDMNPLELSSRAIIAQNLRIDVLHKPTGEYRPLMHNGEELVLDSEPLLSKFGAQTPIVLLRRLFGRDANLIDAGQALLAAAGYLDGDGDDDDPSSEPVGVRRKKKR